MNSSLNPLSCCEDAKFEIREDGFQHCAYCGSIHPLEFEFMLKDGDSKIEFADMKYGYPHKFYIRYKGRMYKFYSKHLGLCNHELADNCLILII